MIDSMDRLLTSIATCNDQLERAEDRRDLDSFNYWFAERERLYCERDNALALLGGV